MIWFVEVCDVFLPEKGGRRKQGFQASGYIQTPLCIALLSSGRTSEREDCTGTEHIHTSPKPLFSSKHAPQISRFPVEVLPLTTAKKHQAVSFICVHPKGSASSEVADMGSM